jgi:hypothetical protein
MAAAGTKRPRVGPRDHLVQVYGHDAELIGGVGDYLLGALSADGVAIVIATSAQRCAFEDWLVDAGIDVASARARGAYLALDASQTAGRFMADGRPDRASFERVVGGVIREAAQSGRPVRAYGEMVALLADDGLVSAAIELEAMWNELGRHYPFALICAYPAQSVARDAQFADLCLLHGAVVAAAGVPLFRAFPFTPGAPAEARHFAVAVAQRLGAGYLADDVALVVTELAANAVRHAGSGFRVVLSYCEGILRVFVHDEGELPSGARLPAAPMHGLGMVSVLASEWGVRSLGADGKVVWALFSGGGRGGRGGGIATSGSARARWRARARQAR